MKKSFRLLLLTTAITLGLSICNYGYAFQVTVQNMVGITSGTYNTIPLPAKIKASSDFVPLFRINLSTNASSFPISNNRYSIDIVTITIKGISNFNPTDDLLELTSDGLTLFKDGPYASTNTWGVSSSETKVLCGYSPNTWATAGSTTTATWSVKMQPSSTLYLSDLASSSVNYTFYVCVKTSGNISDGDNFRAKIDALGDVSVTIRDNVLASSDTFKPAIIAVSTMTADTVAPIFQSVYSPNAASGDTLTVDNTATYNVYSTTDIYSSASNTINVKVTLIDSYNMLTDTGLYPAGELFTLDTTAIDAAISNTKTVSGSGTNTEYTINYIINSSTINSETTALPLRIKVRDAAGNESSWDESFRLNLDRNKPSAVVPTTPAADAWIGTSGPQVSWPASTDPNLLGYYIIVSTDSDLSDFLTNGTGNGWRYFGDDVLIINCFWNTSGSWNNYFPVTSTTTIYYWGIVAKDKAGNIGTFFSRTFKFDDSAPNIYNNLPSGTTTNAQPTISAKIDDAIGGTTMSGIDFSTVTLRIKNQEVVISTETVDTTTTTVKYTPSTALADGTYTVNLWVQDIVGKTNNLSWSFIVDSTKPEIKDTDNDGYSDYDEISQNKDLNDSNSKPTSPADFYPLSGQIVNASEFVTTKSEKIRIRIDDRESVTGIDFASSTSSVVVSLLSKGASEQYRIISEVNGSTCSIFYVQLSRALADNGTDDGVVQVTLTAKDLAGNTASSAITRSFIYDNTKPTISTVTAPSTGDTATSVTFTIDANDTNGISSDANAVQLRIYIDGTDTSYTMSPTGITNRYTITLPPFSQAKTYYYYFYAVDKAGNIQRLPSNANSDSSYALSMIVSDKTAPQSTIYQIETLLNYRLSGGTTYYTAASPSSNNVKSLPTMYADPASDTTNNYNVIRATVPAETTEVLFEYKLSTAAAWTSITANKTDKTVSSNAVWQTYWDTTGLSVNTYYDIRVKAKDAANNSDTPTSNYHPGWVTLYLKPALAPVATISTSQNFPQDGNFVSGNKLILNASTSTTVNANFKEVKFQYKKINDPDTAWTDIAVDSDTTSVTPTNVTLYFREDEIPYMNAFNGLQISSSTINTITVDEQSGTQYDAQMTKSGNVWTATLSLIPNTYKFLYKITKQDNTIINLNRDSHEYGNSGGYSQITISPFSCQWDLSNLASGQTYQLRCIAKDVLDNIDDSPSYISFTYDNIAPEKPIISQPVTNQRILASSQITVKVSLSTSTANSSVSTMVFEYSNDSGQNWQTFGGDMVGTNGWSMNWTAPNVTKDTTYLFRAIAWDTPPQISAYSDTVSVLIDATTPQISSFWVEGATSTVNLNSGTAYILKATSLDSDISKITFSAGGGITGSFTPDNGVVLQSTGSGTSTDPYIYSCTFVPNNTDAITGTVTATITDFAGNNSAKTINAIVLDVTPSVATINQINIDDDGDGNYEEDTANGTDTDSDGMIDEDAFNYVTSGSMMYIGKNTANFSASVSNLDGGTVKFQYTTSLTTGSWITFAEVTAAATVVCSLNPLSQGIPAGIYYLRTLAVDDDNNIDPNPSVVQVNLDFNSPKISSLITPTGSIDCSKTFTLSAQTYDTDVSRIMFQYRDPATAAWTPVTTTTANLIRLVSSTLTPNSVGGNTAAVTVSAPNTTKTTSMDVRAFVFDRAGNRNTETAYAPVTTLTFEDNVAPNAIISSVANGTLTAETSDANIKSVLFQYRLSGSTTSAWSDLAVSIAASVTFGNVGTQWLSGNTLAILPAGTFDLRAVATDQFNNANADKSPIITVLIQNTVAGSKTYSLKKSSVLFIGVSDIQFGTGGTINFKLEVKSNTPLTAAPTANLLITDGSTARITQKIELTGSGTSFSGNVELANFGSGGNARITVSGETASGIVYGETTGLILSTVGTAPTATSPDTMARVTAMGTLNNSTSLLIVPSANTTVSAAQSSLLTIVGRTYEFVLADSTSRFPAGITATCRLDYSDADIPTGTSENKIGVVYWDSVNSKWSSEGITAVNLNQTNNQVTFVTNHFTQFALMIINSTPNMAFLSPVNNGYAGTDPIISVTANDSLSGIRAFRIEIDGNDITATLAARAASDGIDNDGNGLIDETGGNAGAATDDEPVVTFLSPTSAKYVAKAALGLTPGTHKMTITVTNQQGISSSQTIEFRVGTQLENLSTYNYPNPFASGKELTTIRFDLTRDARVTIKVYDFAGNLVATVKNEESMNAGPQRIEWGGTDDETKRYLANGVYLCRIEANDGTKTVKDIIKIAILR